MSTTSNARSAVQSGPDTQACGHDNVEHMDIDNAEADMKTRAEISEADIKEQQNAEERSGEHGSCVMVCQPAEAGLLVAMLEQIAAELEWQPGEQLRSYASTAIHFAAYVNGVLAGGLQLVPSTLCNTLPCELVWPEVSLPSRARTAHISIMAVRREYRGSAGLMWPLCVAMWRYCVAQRIMDITLEVTPKTYLLYKRLGWPLEIAGELRPHWGDDLCYLCRMGAIEVAGAMLLKAPRSAIYRDIVGQMSRPWEVPAPLPLQPAAVSGIVMTDAFVTETR